MSPKEAIANSNLVIFFGCVTRFIRNYNNKHPLKDATAIDYSVVTCQMPLLMSGTYIGVFLNEFLPEFLVFVLLFVTLVYLSYKGIQHSIEAWKKDNEAIRKKKEQALANSINKKKDEESEKNLAKKKEDDLFKPLLKTSNRSLGGAGLIASNRKSRVDSRQSMAKGPEIDNFTQGIDDDDKKALIGERRSTYMPGEVNHVLDNLLKMEKQHFRLRTIIVVTIPFFAILLISLFRGNKNLESIVGIKRCDPLDFILLAFQFLLLIVLTVINIVMLKREYQVKLDNDYQFVKGDIVWDQRSIIKFTIFAVIGGFISGAVGLSGGILFTPLFLDFGIAPSVASGTSMYMAMFATLSSSILFMFSGYIIYDYSFWLSFWAIVGTALGITIIGNAVKKSGRVSILVVLLGFVITASMIAEGIVGTIDTIDQVNNNENLFEFNAYC
eukprot:CAMPEP_0168319052 /NCGR_PEP_ID=MMETSP0213-20121227/833_1 /TAXON_ID=151035 /ORGANISM="Euplotes harpa, Strain FSP1.4" /LENGTH=440 /DNA_ID=CAMNT_0008320213 /DNA_START=326 /DNA_END=1648 /DNA_ORIENTATION=-